MIRYVTDTMALVSYIGKRRLPTSVKQIFQMADIGLCQIIIPVIVFFEVSYLFERGRIDVSPQNILDHLAKYSNYLKQDLSFEIVIESFKITDIPELHDRMIGGMAKFLDAELITNDPVIIASSSVKTLWI